MPGLETQVNVLASLITRLATVREVSAGNLPVHLRSAITNVSSFAQELASSEVQDALAMAEMEHNVRATDLQNSRREIRQKRKQVDTAPPAKRPPTKTQPYPPRVTGQTDVVLTRDTLPAFSESFNRANPNASVSIWTQTDSTATHHSALRIVVPNVLVGYVSLRNGRGQDHSLKPDSVSVVGIREQRATSEFSVFRSISQYIFKAMAENKDISIPDLVSLVASYQNLYSATCDKCNRICSTQVATQDNTPTVIRVWTETDQAQWIPRCYHESCTTS